MYNIVKKERLSDDVTRMSIKALRIAKKRKAGQFIILRSSEDGERIPLTMVDGNAEEGTIDIIFQVVGRSTREFDQLEVGDSFCDVVGPLGCPTEVEDYGNVVCVGGGIGTAPIYPITKALKEKGNTIYSIVGARTQELLILSKEIEELSDSFYVTTDDGSKGHKGFVTDVLKDILDNRKIDIVFAIGPVPMMKFVCALTKQYEVRTMVSLNAIMIDGTGMCGGCRVSIGGHTKFTCVDGPEFDGHEVDFDELMKRLSIYTRHERESDCKLEEQIKENK